jgi:hypothetical protein
MVFRYLRTIIAGRNWANPASTCKSPNVSGRAGRRSTVAAGVVAGALAVVTLPAETDVGAGAEPLIRGKAPIRPRRG